MARSRSVHNEKENFAVLRKVGSSSLTDEDGPGPGMGWTETEVSDQMGGNLHHPSTRPGVGSDRVEERETW